MTQQASDILKDFGIYYDEEINLRQGLLDMIKPHAFYTNGIDTHVLDYGYYMRVEYTHGFWGGFFGAADSVNVKVYDETQLKNTLEYIYFLRSTRQ